MRKVNISSKFSKVYQIWSVQRVFEFRPSLMHTPLKHDNLYFTELRIILVKTVENNAAV